MMFCQELCLKLHTEPLANQSQNRDFLVVGQKAVGVLNAAHIPVRATSGAISFITGTYHDSGNCQGIETKCEAETHTI
jgi:hypothetical protein